MEVFAKSSILFISVWKDSEFASEANDDLRKKLYLSCLTGFEFTFVLIIFTELFAICLVNLINIFHHISVLCTVKST